VAKVDVIKTSFAAGEFGASLKGRTDVAQYDNACELVENMLVRPYGSVISTPGTRLIAETKLSEAGTDSTVRIIPFVFNQVDSYVLEMGEKYFRFYTDRGQVLAGTSSTIYEIAHSYSSIELNEIQFAQQNDIVIMTHKDYPIQKLTRLGADEWTIEPYEVLGGPFLPDNTTDITLNPSAATVGTNRTITLSATTDTIKFQAGHVGSLWKIAGLVGSDGEKEQGYVKITSVSTATIAIVEVVRALSSDAATKVWAEGAWSAVRGYPARVTYHEGRLWFARTDFEPQGVWGSHAFIYDEFALNEQLDDQGINIKLSSNQSNEIQWLASGNALIASTYGGAHVITGEGGGTITPTNITAKPEVSIGAKDIVPKRIGNFFYYVQRFGKKIRELYYLWDNDAYKAQDKTVYNPEVTGDGIVDMAYQEVPDTVLWCVKEDGEIATLTREIDQEVQGWARQITDGKYESICSIPSQSHGYDEVWVVVRREIDGEVKRYIEVFENMIVPERQDKCLYLHSALEYDAYEDTEDEDADLTLSGTAGTITLTSSEDYFVAEDVGKRVRAIDEDGATLGEVKITAYSEATIVTGTVIYAFDSTTYDAGRWGVSVEALSGLDHLEGKTVKVLADGGVDKPDKVVSSASINLAYDYFVVSVGLPYEQKVYTLPFEAGSSRGTAQGKKQRIYQVAFKLNRSYRGFNVGGTEDMAERVSFRDPSTLLGTPEELFTGILPNINFKDDWRYGSQVFVGNDEPFPIEILSIIAMLETSDK